MMICERIDPRHMPHTPQPEKKNTGLLALHLPPQCGTDTHPLDQLVKRWRDAVMRAGRDGARTARGGTIKDMKAPSISTRMMNAAACFTGVLINKRTFINRDRLGPQRPPCGPDRGRSLVVSRMTLLCPPESCVACPRSCPSVPSVRGPCVLCVHTVERGGGSRGVLGDGAQVDHGSATCVLTEPIRSTR